ncbi:hypothetical protein JQ567_05805 [Bradyrhizobium sp. AUGA SZCCT0431]|nr:hypothetical protein [Bradyrhizobium sp. AUGA SZCCT0431]MBR1142789.1 hypothetical protein [Bradyrhizobium sp. AUGA SZCCT0431]
MSSRTREQVATLTDFRDELKAVVTGVNIPGMENADRVRQIAEAKVDQLFR